MSMYISDYFFVPRCINPGVNVAKLTSGNYKIKRQFDSKLKRATTSGISVGIIQTSLSALGNLSFYGIPDVTLSTQFFWGFFLSSFPRYFYYKEIILRFIMYNVFQYETLLYDEFMYVNAVLCNKTGSCILIQYF